VPGKAIRVPGLAFGDDSWLKRKFNLKEMTYNGKLEL